jgi:signal transduction histidine kinase
LAAAVSHELKSPLGVIRSTSQTLSMLEKKIQEKTSSDQEAEHINSVIVTLCQSIQEASDRMEQVIARMERFTNLGGAVVQQVDLNEILSDVIAMAAPQLEGKLEVQLDLSPLGPLTCRPSQLTAVFASLVDNAIEAVESGGRVAVRSRQSDESIEIQFEDNGAGMSAEQLTSIFEPTFQTVKGRVATGNWSLFSARRVIHEHGGEVRMGSVKGQGTTVTVVLPLENSVEIERSCAPQ